MDARLGKYLLLRKLGAGGMGEVWEAVDTVLERPVAVKVLTADAGEESLREAAAAARVNHPNAVAVYDMAEADGRRFIVMELVVGSDAGRLVEERGPLPWAEATRIVRDAAAGLAAVHAAGLVHRDVKPGNVLIASDGTAKVADFGLAKPASRAGLSAGSRVVGTPHFMSPEQCWNETADGRADVYSLGATYFTLLTGRPPFDRGSDMAVMYAHCNDPVPDARSVAAGVPDGCAAAVRRAMAKQPADRYPSAVAFRQALDELLAGRPPEDSRPRPPVRLPPPTKVLRLNRRRVLAAIPVALAGVAGGLFLFNRTADPTPEPAADPPWAKAMEFGGAVQHLAVSPDGRLVAVAHVATGLGGTDGVTLRRRDGGVVEGWPKTGAGAEGVAFSPDGTVLAGAYRMWQRVCLWDVSTGRDLPVEGGRDVPGACAAAFSADGEWLAVAAYSGDGARVHVWNAADGGWRRKYDSGGVESGVWGLAAARQGHTLAVVTADGDNELARASLHLIDIRTGNAVPGPAVVPVRRSVGPTVAFAAAAPLLAVSSLGAVKVFTVPGWAPHGRPMEILSGEQPCDVWALALSPDGKWAAGAVDVNIHVWRTADGERLAILSRHDGRVTTLAFAPDGRSLLSGSEDGMVRTHDASEWQR